MAATSFTAIYWLAIVPTILLMRNILPETITYYYTLTSCMLLSSIIAYYSYLEIKKWYLYKKVLPHNKAVFITGCDSGFGHGLSKRLDSQGYHVFAGCLFPDGEGAKALKSTCSSRLHVVGIDVTKEESIANALDYVKSNLGKSDFWALVNNAGIIQGLSVVLGKMEQFENCLSVNSLGPVRMTRAFHPLLVKNKGRVVTVASLAGRICMANMAPYTMSKFAAVAFSQCLRLEMKEFGVRVISIEPEFFKTPMSDNFIEGMDVTIRDTDEEVKTLYGEKYFENIRRYSANIIRMSGGNINNVLDSLEHAISLEEPEDVYQPARNVFLKWGIITSQTLPTPLMSTLILCLMKNVSLWKRDR